MNEAIFSLALGFSMAALVLPAAEGNLRDKDIALELPRTGAEPARGGTQN